MINGDSYKNIYGKWAVTTEGDVEGRTITQLGTFTGYVDEIALHLADKACYGLRFKAVEDVTDYIPKKTSVNVSFDIDSGTWNSVKTEKGLDEIITIFKGRPVRITKSNYYASFMIHSNEVNQDDIDKHKALNKLTTREIKLLGL